MERTQKKNLMHAKGREMFIFREDRNKLSLELQVLSSYTRDVTYANTGCSNSNAALTTTHRLLQAQNDQTSDGVVFLHPYPVAAADALPEIGTAVISSCFVVR
jgi:hypothetical protein